MFYATNADGFAVAEKTICSRCAMDPKTYSAKKKELEDANYLIKNEKTKRITVNFDLIYRNGFAEKELNDQKLEAKLKKKNT